MNLLNLALTIVFLGAALWMGKKVLEQKNQIELACRYINAYRIFLLFCLAASVVVMFVGFKDVFDLIRSFSMTVMVALFLCMREGAGKEGFVYSGTLIPYSAVAHYDYKMDQKEFLVYVVFREKTKDTVDESTFTLRFKKEDEYRVVEYLQTALPKKHKRLKKA